MFDFSKKSHVEKYFESIMDELKSSKIKAVFSFCSGYISYPRGLKTSHTDAELYVLFENEKCLVFNYLFLDELELQFRRLTAIEETSYQQLYEKDIFNPPSNKDMVLLDFRSQADANGLEYGCIEKITLRPVTGKYTKWIDGDIGYVDPTEETFSEIKFYMDNEKSFSICADDADADGWIMAWSEDV